MTHPSCFFATCGDGIVQKDVEACDDGMINNDACLTTAQRQGGDGYVKLAWKHVMTVTIITKTIAQTSVGLGAVATVSFKRESNVTMAIATMMTPVCQTAQTRLAVTALSRPTSRCAMMGMG